MNYVTYPPNSIVPLTCDSTEVSDGQYTFGQLYAALAAAQADAALWRQRVLDTRDILNLVEDVSDAPSLVNVQALVDAFDAWRMLVERDAPTMWAVDGEGGAQLGLLDGDGGEELESLF